MKYTREQMEQRIMNYLMKTSKHLFVDEQGRFYKVMLTKLDTDEWAYITVRFNGDFAKVMVKPITVRHSPLHTNDLAYIQDYIFPKNEDRTTIHYFKEARVKMFEVLKTVRKHYDGSIDSKLTIDEECSKILSGLTLKDKTE